MVHWFPDKFEADLVRVAKVAEVDVLEVVGFTLMVHLRDGRAVLITNACCTAHAVAQLDEITGTAVPSLVPCPGDL